MFDLFRRKDTNLRYLLGFLLGMVALSMVITLIPGFGSGGFGGGTGEDNVAKVCGEPVGIREVRLKMDQMLNRSQLPPDSAAIFVPQFIDQLVAVKGVACYANETGLVASDKDVALKIQKDVPSLWQDGKFVGAQMYEAMLRQTGLTVKQFEDSVKKDIEVQRLRTMVLMSAVATPKEVEDAFRETEEKVKLEYAAIEPAEISKTLSVADADIRAEYEKNKNTFFMPEYRKVTLYTIENSRVQAGIKITEEELKRTYNENIDSFRLPERSHVRHILFKTKEKADTEDAKMKALAESVYTQLKGGAKFEDLAKKYSEDPGSKDNGGDVGTIVRGQTVKSFDEYSFSGPLRQLSKPVKTEFGYHLIEVLERFPAAQRTFDEVRPQLEAELRRTRASEALGKTADALRYELQKGVTAGIEEKYSATAMKFDYKGANDNIPGLGTKTEIYEAVRGLKKGEAAAPLTLSADRMLVAYVDEVVPRRQSSFEEARPQIYANMLIAAGNKKTEALKARGIELMNSVNGDLAKLAKELGVPVRTTQMFNRQGFADGLGPASAVIDAFKKKPGEVFGPISVDSKFFFVKVTGREEADMVKLAQRRPELVNLVKNRKASERADIFEETLVKRLIADGQIKINEDVKKRIAASFSN